MLKLQSGSKLLAHFVNWKLESSNPRETTFSRILPPTARFNPFQVSESLAMPSVIPAVKRNRVKVKLGLGMDPKEVGKQTNVSLRTVQRIHTNMTYYGSATTPKASRQGKPRVFRLEIEEVCAFDLDFVAEKLTFSRCFYDWK